ncbi:MAG: Ni/Fe hydrogenase subunit alpha [Deltaproteobacteria bacterium]|nr:Ni/Fe hydrogenase subunit alpha [Deltaproteobacteria bacterium]MDL1961449.1 Ni/Fe hydrogenase subunit alpha [Deltaproteobacteria bacterium]
MTVKTVKSLNIDIKHLSRVEGHGDIRIRVEDGKLAECTWAVVETPRFFEVMFKGLSIEMAPILAARICGICSISHALASARAIERALKIEIPGPASMIRLLAKHAETLQSHSLHLFFLVAPDFLNVPSMIPIMHTNPQVAETAVKIKWFANRAADLLVGRSTHPIGIKIGGLTQIPRKMQLKELAKDLDATIPYLWKTLDLFKGFKMPDFVRETELVSLRGVNRYPFIGGDLISSDGVRKEEDEYRSMTNEYIVDFSNSKLTRLSRESFAVGALARFNNNYDLLHPKAKEAAEGLNLRPGVHNPYFYNLAQLVECFHVMYESKELLLELIDLDTSKFSIHYKVRRCEGIGAVEAPRGILYHYHRISDEGKIEKADCVIPTNQNNGNIYYDLHKLVNELIVQGMEGKEIERLSQMLVRAYDPCISCSVH